MERMNKGACTVPFVSDSASGQLVMNASIKVEQSQLTLRKRCDVMRIVAIRFHHFNACT